MVKSLHAMQETRVQSLVWEDPLEKEMAIHSSTLAWKIPQTEEPGRLQSMGSQMPGKSHGQRSLVGYSPWGRKQSDTSERLHFHCVYYLQRNKTHCNHSRKRCGHSQILFSRCFVHGISQARILEWAAISSSRWWWLFSCSVVCDSLRPPELQHTRPPCPSPTPRVHPNPCPLSR